MTGYSGFLIAPFGTGLDTDVQPWLLPQNAFSEINNGDVHHGVVQKREGFVKQGDLVHQDQTNWKISNVTAASPAVVTVVSTTGLAAADIIEIRNVAGMTQVNGNQYTISATNFTGTTFEIDNVDSSLFTAYSGSAGDVYLIPQNRVMGLERYIDSGGAKEVIAFDTKRASAYNPSLEAYTPLDSVNIFNGESTDYIWADNWASTASSTASTQYNLYFTNGLAYSAGPPVVNGIRRYNGGTTTTLFRPQINASAAGPFINGCKLIFAYRQRLILLHTIEGSNTYPQRVRWCQAQGPLISDGWDDAVAGKGGFVDAPTGDHIISAEFVQDIVIVYFTNSVWTLRATADPALPFRWDKINDFRGCDGKMTTEQFDRYVIAAGVRGITATDGVETRRFDDKIEDFVSSTINDSQFEKVFTKRSFQARRMWMLYPPKSDTDATAALIYDEESSAFSNYDIAMNVLGYGGAATDKALDDFGDKTLGEFGINETLQSFFWDSGAEIFIGGNRTGEVFVMEQGGDDNETLFTADIVNATIASPSVLTITGDVGLSDGDVVSIDNVGGVTGLDGREFVVESKSGNSITLKGSTATGTYTSGGTVRATLGNSIEFNLTSAAWNPWMSEGKQCQMGYIDLFLDTHSTSTLTVKFYANNDMNWYSEKTINLLPNLREIALVTAITSASPGQVTACSHGLSNNDEIYIYTVVGMSGANGGPYTVTVVDKDNFTIGVDTRTFGAYKNGGVLTELEFFSDKAWKRVYAGGTGYQHKIRLESSGRNTGVRINAFMPWFKPRGHRAI